MDWTIGDLVEFTRLALALAMRETPIIGIIHNDRRMHYGENENGETEARRA